MRSLGLVLEGQTEYAGVPALLKRVGITPGRGTIFRGQGLQCPVETLVRKRLLAATRTQILKGHSKVLVIIDRETRNDCPGDFAQRLEAELIRQLQGEHGYGGIPPLSVVCADRTFENWLIADPQGIGGHAYIQRNISQRVGNNADDRDALAIIEWAYGPRRHYHKTKDAPALAARVRVERADVRQRSKSLRKLLREACL